MVAASATSVGAPRSAVDLIGLCLAPDRRSRGGGGICTPDEPERRKRNADDQHYVCKEFEVSWNVGASETVCPVQYD